MVRHILSWRCEARFLSWSIPFAILPVSPALAQPLTCSTTPTFVQYPPPVDQGYFASDMALDGDGDMALVGEIFGDGDPVNPIDKSGTVRAFSRLSGQWYEVQTIQHDTPLVNDFFGASVDVSGNSAIVAAPGRALSLGAVFILERDISKPINEQWSEVQELSNPGIPPNQPPTIDDGFGGSLTRHETVAIDRNLAVVGASGTVVDGKGSAGVVHVYYFNTTLRAWELEMTVTAPFPEPGDQFGYSVDISGTRVIVGEPFRPVDAPNAGKAYVFRRNVPGTPSWVLEDELTADPPPYVNDRFGWSVAIEGTNAIVGAPNTGLSGAPPGFAAVFHRVSATEWVQDEGGWLAPSNEQDEQAFGYAVRLRGSTALIGAPSYDVPDGPNLVGTAYLYQRPVGGVWGESLQLLSNQGGLGDRVGETMALDGAIFVGVLSDEPGPPSGLNYGSVLIFDPPTCSY